MLFRPRKLLLIAGPCSLENKRVCRAVAEALAKEGVKTSNAGGFRDWVAAGLPVRKVDEKGQPKETDAKK